MYYFENNLFYFMLNWNHTFCLEEVLLFHSLHTMDKYLNHPFLWAKLKGESLATLYPRQGRCGAACQLLRAHKGLSFILAPLHSGQGRLCAWIALNLLAVQLRNTRDLTCKTKNASRKNQIYDKENRHFWTLITWLSGISGGQKKLRITYLKLSKFAHT